MLEGRRRKECNSRGSCWGQKDRNDLQSRNEKANQEPSGLHNIHVPSTLCLAVLSTTSPLQFKQVVHPLPHSDQLAFVRNGVGVGGRADFRALRALTIEEHFRCSARRRMMLVHDQPSPHKLKFALLRPRRFSSLPFAFDSSSDLPARTLPNGLIPPSTKISYESADTRVRRLESSHCIH